MSSKINLEVIEGDGLDFVPRLSNASLEALLKELPDGQQLEPGDSNRLAEIEHEGKLLPLFATPPKWAAFPAGAQV